MECVVSDYNTKNPYSLLNYMTPEDFESAILDEDFRNKCIKKEIMGYKHVNYLGEMRNTFEGMGSRSGRKIQKKRLFAYLFAIIDFETMLYKGSGSAMKCEK